MMQSQIFILINRIVPHMSGSVYTHSSHDHEKDEFTNKKKYKQAYRNRPSKTGLTMAQEVERRKELVNARYIEVMKDGPLVTDEIAVLLKINRASAFRRLKVLEGRGVVEKIGKKKMKFKSAVLWRLTDNYQPA